MKAESPSAKKPRRPAAKAPAKRPRGRPSVFTKEVVQALLDGIEGGQTLRQVCSGENMPSERSVLRRVAENEAFRHAYARARELRCESYEDRLLEIGNDALVMALRLVGSQGASGVVQSYAIRAANLRYLISLDRAPAVAAETIPDRLPAFVEEALLRVWADEAGKPASNQATN